MINNALNGVLDTIKQTNRKFLTEAVLKRIEHKNACVFFDVSGELWMNPNDSKKTIKNVVAFIHLQNMIKTQLFVCKKCCLMIVYKDIIF